jgi:hypothetical protein
MAIGAPAHSAPDAKSWPAAAAQVKFPLYQPMTVPRGLPIKAVNVMRCGPNTNVQAAYYKSTSAKAPILAFDEAPSSRARCGDAGERQYVGTVTIQGQRVKLGVFCYSPGPRCTRADGANKTGYIVDFNLTDGGRTWIQASSRFLTLKEFLTALQSLTRVPKARRVTQSHSALTPGFFKTPSGNILCSFAYDTRKSDVGCVIKSGFKPPLAGRHAGCKSALVITLSKTGRPRPYASWCPGDDYEVETPYVGDAIAKTLPYGKTWRGGGITCTSSAQGLTCRNRSGRGFFLSRERWRSL